jgi:hypothetical protein
MKKHLFCVAFSLLALTVIAAKKIEGVITYNNNQTVKVVFLIRLVF